MTLIPSVINARKLRQKIVPCKNLKYFRYQETEKALDSKCTTTSLLPKSVILL